MHATEGLLAKKSVPDWFLSFDLPLLVTAGKSKHVTQIDPDFYDASIDILFCLRERKREREREINSSPKAVSGQRYPCPTWVESDLGWEGAGQWPRRGRSLVEHRGNLSVCAYVPPPPSGLHLLWGPNPNCMAQIQAKWPKSSQNEPNPGKMAQDRAIWAKSS